MNLAVARNRFSPPQVTVAEASATTAARFEIKYWATEAQASNLVRWAAPHVVPDPHVADTGGRGFNVSLYFDSPRLSFFEQHLAALPDRVKLRVRTYAAPQTEGRSDPPRDRAFLEVKRRVGAMTLKQRTVVARADAVAIAERRFDQAACLNGLPGRDLEAFLFLQQRYAVQPVVVVRARRQSLIGVPEEGSFRLTMDRDISYQPAMGVELDGHRRGSIGVNCPGQVLIELKFCDAAPAWLGSSFERLGLARTSFSKYVAAVGQELGR